MRKTDRFVTTKSPLYQATLEAITKLRKTEGADRTERCVAEACTEPTYNAFANRYGLRLASRACIHRLIDQRCPGDESLLPPCRDHAHLWTYGGLAAVFTMEPYEREGKDVAECFHWAEAHDLLMLISPKSGHFYGATLWIQLWRKDVFEAVSASQNWEWDE